MPWVRISKLFLFFVSFVVQKLVLTMKGLKEILTLLWTRRIEPSHFFMPFVVTKLVRLFTMKNTMSMKAAPIYPWARKQGSPSISSCASWLVGLYRSSPCPSWLIRLYGGYPCPSWLGASNHTALSVGCLKCQPLAKPGTLDLASNRGVRLAEVGQPSPGQVNDSIAPNRV